MKAEKIYIIELDRDAFTVEHDLIYVCQRELEYKDVSTLAKYCRIN